MPYDGEKIRTLQRGRHGHSREAQGESRDQDVSAEEMLRYYRDTPLDPPLRGGAPGSSTAWA
jgi:hypothetical protein